MFRRSFVILSFAVGFAPAQLQSNPAGVFIFVLRLLRIRTIASRSLRRFSRFNRKNVIPHPSQRRRNRTTRGRILYRRLSREVRDSVIDALLDLNADPTMVPQGANVVSNEARAIDFDVRVVSQSNRSELFDGDFYVVDGDVEFVDYVETGNPSFMLARAEIDITFRVPVDKLSEGRKTVVCKHPYVTNMIIAHFFVVS